MKVKDKFLNLGSFQLNNGENIRFWEDKWLGNFTLSQQYPSLYNIARKKHISIATVFNSIPLNISFRRGLVGNNLVLWYNLVARIAQVRLNDREDVFKWGLHQSGIFSVHSMYSALICNGHVRQNRTLWKTRIPLKIKIFLWYLHRGVVLTKDNLARRNWNGSKKCVFCSHNETIQHLFFDCHFAKFLWRVVQYTFGLVPPTSAAQFYNDWLFRFDCKSKTQLLCGVSVLCWAPWLSRNDIVFDNSPMKTYMQVLFRVTHWLRMWSLVQKCDDDTNLLKDACRSLETTAMQIFANHGWRFSNRIAA